MELEQKSNGLSLFVAQEMNTLRLDDTFNDKSQKIFGELSSRSWLSDLEFEEYSELHHLEISGDDEQISKWHQNFGKSDNDDICLMSHEEHSFEFNEDRRGFINSKLSTLGEDSNLKEISDSWKSSSLIQEEPHAINIQKISQQKTETKKNKSLRDIEPVDFLSLKRKDVVFKSIFRMMRRYFWKLFEDATGYNRKEKCLNSKHKALIKSLGIGMDTMNFNQFGTNMPFYFGAFAYSNDMRKILDESKQQFRTQNEVLSQWIYIVELVDTCFNRFSKKVLSDLMAVPQFSFFINHYLNNAGDLSGYPKPFQNCYSSLQKAEDMMKRSDEEASRNSSRSHAFILQNNLFLFDKSDSL